MVSAPVDHHSDASDLWRQRLSSVAFPLIMSVQITQTGLSTDLLRPRSEVDRRKPLFLGPQALEKTH
jgi:hypothetical protein